MIDVHDISKDDHEELSDPGGEEEEALIVDDDEELIDEEDIDVDELEDLEGTGDDCSDDIRSDVCSPTTDIQDDLLESPPALAGCPLSDSPRSSSESSTVSNQSLTHPASKSHSTPEKKHVCDECGKAFPYYSILESHKRCHTGEKPFACPHDGCDKKFAQKATLQVHERTHTGERPYKCRYCDKRFAQYGTKTVHEKSAHLGIRNYKCPKCDKCLSSPSALYTHKKTHGEKTFHCQFCPKTFTLKNYLKLHVKQVHEQNERKHICKYCNKSFAYAGSLQVHIRTHTGERPYPCRFCTKRFASQGNLQSHERTHTGERPYSCGQCGRSFIQKSQLTAHESTHSLPAAIPAGTPLNGPERKNEFACKYCGKSYAYASSLYVHTRQHTGERPFSCKFCDKTFTNQGNMQAHLRVHTGEKPFACMACGKSYGQKISLKIHMENCVQFVRLASTASPVSTGDSSSDCSDEFRRNEFIVPNIYRDVSPVAPLTAPTAFTNYSQPSMSLADFAMKLPTSQLSLSGLPHMPSVHQTQPLSAFTAPELPPADFGPLTASQPPLSSSLTDSITSAFSAPTKVLDPQLLLQSLLLDGLTLPQLPLLGQLSTQLLLQQLQGNLLSSLTAPSQTTSLLSGLLPLVPPLPTNFDVKVEPSLA